MKDSSNTHIIKKRVGHPIGDLFVILFFSLIPVGFFLFLLFISLFITLLIIACLFAGSPECTECILTSSQDCLDSKVTITALVTYILTIGLGLSSHSALSTLITTHITFDTKKNNVCCIRKFFFVPFSNWTESLSGYKHISRGTVKRYVHTPHSTASKSYSSFTLLPVPKIEIIHKENKKKNLVIDVGVAEENIRSTIWEYSKTLGIPIEE